MAGDSTQFLIDMAARLTGGDASVATLTDLGDRMLKAGATANELERTVKTMSSAFDQSASALKASSDALSDGEAKYRAAEVSADRAAKAVERLNASGKSGDKFAAKQAEAASKAEAAAVALKAEAVAVDALKAKAGAAAVQHEALSKGLKNVKGAAEQAAKAEAAAGGSGKVNEIAEAFGKLGGPAGAAGQKIFGLASGFKKLGAGIGSAGLYVGIAVAIVAIATAALVATIAISKWAVGLADANRTQTLLAAGVARSVQGGAELDATISKLGNVVPQTREELLNMAGDLAKTGLRGKELTGALEDAAVKAAKLKWGPDFAKQLLSMDVQTRKLGTNLSDTFGGLHIEKLLGGVSTLVALFDSTTESGKALKFLFEALFQPIIDGATGAIPAVERLFLYAEILALKAYIALKPYQGAIKFLAETFLVVAAVVLGVLGVAIAVVFGSIAATILGPILLIGLLVAAVVWLATTIYENLGAAVTFMTDLGANMIGGLVNGITGAGSAVVNAIGGVVSGAIDHAKHLLGIASPSKVFAGIGDFTAQGFAEGVEGGASDAQGALEKMVATPAGKGGAGAGAGGGVSVVVQSMIVQGENAKALAEDFIEQITKLLEGDALTIGGGEAHA